MKWDRSKKKKFPDIEIEMSNTHYNGQDEKITRNETSIQMIPMWSTKQNIDISSQNIGVKEHSFILQSGDSGIESVRVCVLITTKYLIPYYVENILIKLK